MLSTWVRRLRFKVLVGENLFLALYSVLWHRSVRLTLGPAVGQNTRTHRQYPILKLAFHPLGERVMDLRAVL